MGKENMNYESHGFHCTIWLGALFLYLLNFGRKPFNHFYDERRRTRNFILGSVVGLVFFISLFSTVIWVRQ